MDFTSIPNSQNWRKVEEVKKGWSRDKKYYIEDADHKSLLLRISSIEAFEQKKAEYQLVKRCNTYDFPMSHALDFGTCNHNQNTYMLLTWVDGTPLEECISHFTAEKQYQLGYEAGKYLKQIHSLLMNERVSNWHDQMAAKIHKRIEDYQNGKTRVQNDELPIQFVNDHLHLLQEAELVYQHGDFHIGNLLYTQDGKIGVIDFNRCDIGDYVEEFYKVQFFDREHSIPFARGKVDGYFDGPPPLEFWQRQALYVAYISLFNMVWALPFGEKSVDEMIGRYHMVMEDYDNFQRVIPKWYDGDKSF